jgi:hypothetical protein
MKRGVLLMLALVALSGCTCKQWGYCPKLFPNAERFASDERV